MLLYFIEKFTPRTAGLLQTEPKLCEMFLQLLSISKPLFHGHMSPQEAVLNQVKTETHHLTNLPRTKISQQPVCTALSGNNSKNIFIMRVRTRFLIVPHWQYNDYWCELFG